MAKFGDKASESVERAMRKRNQGTLRSGSGEKVVSRAQAIAIGLSEARAAGGKVPAKPATSKTATKTSARHAAPKKTVAKHAPAKQPGAGKSPARSAAGTHTVARKSAANKSAKKTSSRKGAAQ